MNRNKTQLGYFIDFDLWQDALKLLNFQIQQTNKHFNTLSMFYYKKNDKNCIIYNTTAAKEYFDIKISSNLFYGLKKEFAVLPYVIPKPGLGLRDYKFFTYPMRAVYYAVGLYLVKLSEDFIKETYQKIENIKSFYGGHLHYKSDKLQLNDKNIYYYNFYKKFQEMRQELIKNNSKNKIVLFLDVENYFNELSIPTLLKLLDNYIKPSLQKQMSFDIYTKEQIISFFQFIQNDKSGIPQAENNIISDFIGYLYLVFGDLFIDNILSIDKNVIKSYEIFRYADDIYISMIFENDINSEKYIHNLASQIADIFYSKLGLKLNSKTRLYRLSKKDEKEEFIKKIRCSSESEEYLIFEQEEEKDSNQKYNSVKAITPQDKLNKIFQELRKIKKSKVEDYFIRDNLAKKETLQEIFDKGVDNIINKPVNKKKLRVIFRNFNFDLIKVKPLEILIILLKNQKSTQEFKEFCLRKNIITTGDADLIIKFLCQTNFKDEELLNKLKQNEQMKNIINVFLDGKLNCDKPGYYSLGCLQIKKLLEMPDVIEQIRLRVLSERNASYSVALNHLVNEIHAVCIKQGKTNKKEYDVNDVVKFLQSKGIQHEIYIKIKNLFDRRNSNSVSHPGSDDKIAWRVTEEEYLDYYNNVGKCLEFLLS